MEDRFRLRAWDIDEKTMVYLLFSDGNLRDKDGIIHGSYQDLMESESFSTPMQCTALRDKYGKLIYEGDIVNGGVDPFTLRPYLGIIKFGNVFGYQAFFVQWNDKFNSIRKDLYYWIHADDTGLEVIGNKYENPELLKGGKNEV